MINSPAWIQKVTFTENMPLGLRIAIVIIIAFLLNPDLINADTPLKTLGTAETNVAVWIPTGAVDVEVTATADYVAEKDLPNRIKYPSGTVGQAFSFGIWDGDGTALTEFSPSVVINVKYLDDDIPPSVRDDEPTLHLHMYNPATKSWNKLCSSVDVHGNVVSAALSSATPLESGSNLLAVAADFTAPLEQNLNDQGSTVITMDGSDLTLEVEPQIIDNGTHFAISLLPAVSSGSRVKILDKPLDIKACFADKTRPDQNNRQVTKFSKPLTVGFQLSSDTVSRSGGQENLTVVTLQNGRWIDIEEMRRKVERSNRLIAVDTQSLGTFGLGAR
jgi:hypothetical protein